MKCSICGIELNALNMSDIEYDKCQDCVRNIINKIDTDDESVETIHMPDSSLDSIIRQKNDRIRNNVRGGLSFQILVQSKYILGT